MPNVNVCNYNLVYRCSGKSCALNTAVSLTASGGLHCIGCS